LLHKLQDIITVIYTENKDVQKSLPRRDFCLSPSTKTSIMRLVDLLSLRGQFAAMKTALKVAAAAVVVGGGIWAGSLMNLTAEGAGVSTQPGTADDPVVTKSYVDQAIQQAIKGGGTTTAPTTPTNPTTPPNPTAPAKSEDNGASADAIEIVEVKPGKILIASAGAEFIVRAGKAVVYSEDTSGVADLTDGKDIGNGGAVANNHLLSFPRAGRGIQVAEGNKYNLTVMVRGGYSVK